MDLLLVRRFDFCWFKGYCNQNRSYIFKNYFVLLNIEFKQKNTCWCFVDNGFTDGSTDESTVGSTDGFVVGSTVGFVLVQGLL